jgi:hypothetical protein
MERYARNEALDVQLYPPYHHARARRWHPFPSDGRVRHGHDEKREVAHLIQNLDRSHFFFGFLAETAFFFAGGFGLRAGCIFCSDSFIGFGAFGLVVGAAFTSAAGFGGAIICGSCRVNLRSPK